MISQSSTEKNPHKKEAETVQEGSEMSSLLCEDCGRGLTHERELNREGSSGGDEAWLAYRMFQTVVSLHL